MERDEKVNFLAEKVGSLCLRLNSLKELRDQTYPLLANLLSQTFHDIRIQMDMILNAYSYKEMLRHTRITHAFVLNAAALYNLFPQELGSVTQIVRSLEEISGEFMELEQQLDKMLGIGI